MRIMHMEDLYYQETYRGYQLNEGVLISDLSSTELTRLDACIDLIDQNKSLTWISENYEIPRSTLYDFIHKRLSALSVELSSCVKRHVKKFSRRV